MIELAPYHKIGLNLKSPVLIAAGFGGYGDAYQRLIDLPAFGAVITGPITLRPERGAPQPRLVEIPGGFILNTGQQNPGVKKIIRVHKKSWFRLETPVIAHLPAEAPDNLTRTARALSKLQTTRGESALAALELAIPPESTGLDIVQWIRAIQAGSELPLLVKLPFGFDPSLAEAAARQQADALVIGSPPLAAAYFDRRRQPVTGHQFGPALHSLTLHNLTLAADFELPLAAVGGVHTVADVKAFLAAGATAVQLDSLLFLDPQAAAEIARHFSETRPQTADR